MFLKEEIMKLPNSKKFWVAQALELVITVAMFAQMITFELWFAKTILIEGGWFGADVVEKFSPKKGEKK